MNLSIKLVQASLQWENIQENLDHLGQLLEKSYDPAELIILPESFPTGFTMNVTGFGEDLNGKAMTWMATQAAKRNCIITGSLIILDHGKYYNRLVWMKPDGSYEYYDKKHLFRMAGEDLHFTPGSRKLITRLNDWRVRPLVCYDLRFPVWSRNVNDYDLLIYVANWPDNRIDVWNTLLKARAMENQCYVAGVNITGRDNDGTSYSGHSAVIDFRGNILASAPLNEEAVINAGLSLESLKDYKLNFPSYLDADEFEIQN
ncbi:MAG: amidohydrolase [Bacteroidia bacterium]|nr:amidohydrolase [Bacteroidia bacterium]